MSAIETWNGPYLGVMLALIEGPSDRMMIIIQCRPAFSRWPKVTDSSPSEMDLDGFTVVKKGGRRKTFKRTTVLASREDHQDELDLDKETAKVKEAVAELRKTQLFSNLSDQLKVISCEELWCFGLGHIAGCVSSRFQLALLLIIRCEHCSSPRKKLILTVFDMVILGNSFTYLRRESLWMTQSSSVERRSCWEDWSLEWYQRTLSVGWSARCILW